MYEYFSSSVSPAQFWLSSGSTLTGHTDLGKLAKRLPKQPFGDRPGSRRTAALAVAICLCSRGGSAHPRGAAVVAASHNNFSLYLSNCNNTAWAQITLFKPALCISRFSNVTRLFRYVYLK